MNFRMITTFIEAFRQETNRRIEENTKAARFDTLQVTIATVQAEETLLILA